MMVIQIVIDSLETVPKGFEMKQEKLEICTRIGIIRTAALFISATILRRILERSEETFCHSHSSERPSANTGVKISKK